MALCRIFKNAKILERSEVVQRAVCVVDRHILCVLDSKELQDFQDNTQYNYEVIDCEGHMLLPSSIDLNVLPLDKKFHAKSLHQLANKALLGGTTTLFLNPYTDPYIDNEAMIALLENINKTEIINLYGLIGNVNADGKLNNIDTLCNFGEQPKVIFSYSHINSNLLYQTMQYAKMLNAPLCIFAFDPIIEQGVAYESTFARELGLPMMTPIGQLKEVAKIKEMARFLDIEVIFLSSNLASCIGMLDLNERMYAQVSLAHLLFSERDIGAYDTRFKLKPPLVTRSKKEKLIACLQQGKIAMLTSLQSEVSSHFKDELFELAIESVTGIEHFFAIAYTSLVKTGIISLPSLIKLTSANASDLLGLNKGSIEAGRDADFMIVDLSSKYRIIDPFSIYNDMEVFGKIKYMVVNGMLHDIKTIDDE